MDEGDKYVPPGRRAATKGGDSGDTGERKPETGDPEGGVVGTGMEDMLNNIPSPNASDRKGTDLNDMLNNIPSPNASERKGGLGGLGLGP